MKNSGSSYDLVVDGDHNFADTLPVIGVLRLSIDHLKALQDVYDIINATSLHTQFPCALIKVEHGAAFASIEAQKPSAELPKTFLLATILILRTIR